MRIRGRDGFNNQLSERIEETPEGFLICRDSVVARTGFQKYTVGDLPGDAAEKLGVDTSNPWASIQLYRSEDDVFHPDFMASLEGKPVTDNHPPGFVEPSNFEKYACGHIHNVRRGEEPLESGDWPLIADLYIERDPLLSKVKNNQVRELSLGYDYSIRREGDKILQCDMMGNHCAVVPQGRAGPEARINDSADPSALDVNPNPAIGGKMAKFSLNSLLGLGFKEFAKNAEPEQVAAAMVEIRGRAADSDEPDFEMHRQAENKPAVAAFDFKKAFDEIHERIDKLESARKSAGEDADLENLKNNLDEYLSEEEKEPEHKAEDHAEGCDCESCHDAEHEGNNYREGVHPEEGQREEIASVAAHPNKELLEDDFEETEPNGREVIVPAGDRLRAADGAREVLRNLRPFVARSNDKALHNAFNTALASVTRASKPSVASYDAVNKAAGRSTKKNTYAAFDGAVKGAQSSNRKKASDSAADRNKRLQDAYNAALKETK